MRRFIPSFLLTFYHWLWAVGSAVFYGQPSRRLIVIGVTGTKGKSTTAFMTHHLLMRAGHKAGLLSSVGYKIGEEDVRSVDKMTMPGRGKVQQMLRHMVKAGCTHVVIETSSEGIKQFRHVGIRYDVVVLTNLTPEHIESHGSYEAYRAAKADLFERTSRLPRKRLHGEEIPRVRVLPVSLKKEQDLAVFLAPSFPVNMRFGIEEGDVQAWDVVEETTFTSFRLQIGDAVQGVELNMPGRFNVLNTLAASAAASALGVSSEQLAAGIGSFPGIPGRMEVVYRDAFTVIVDYAHEPASYTASLTTARELVRTGGRLFALIGATGGGRDVARRPQLGEIAAELADVVFVTNEDPYDEDPQKIIDDVFSGVVRADKLEHQNAFRILDRQEAITLAVSQLRMGDVFILLGKGSERVIAVAKGKHVPWSDKQAVLDALHR